MEALKNQIVAPVKMSSETSIIQCPACSTKFSVKTAAFNQQTSARFHCSRCDHVFTVEMSALESATSAANAIPPEKPKVAQAFTPSNIAATGFGEDAQQALAAATRAQIELDFKVAHSSVAPIPNPNQDFRVTPDEPRQSPEDSFQLSKFNSAVETTKDSTSEAPKISTARSEQIKRNVETFPRPEPLQFDFSKTNAAPDTQIRPFATSARPNDMPRSPGRWSSAGVLLTILGAFIGLFLIFGVLISFSPTLASRVFALAPKVAQAAPSDVFVRTASVEKIILDGGQAVTVLSGEIQNDSLTNFSSVDIEAAIYDESDQAISTVLTSTSSGLARDRLKSYPPAMLDVLQHSRLPRSGELKAGERKDFMAVFTLEQAAQAKYFSTRVYTVTE